MAYMEVLKMAVDNLSGRNRNRELQMGNKSQLLEQKVEVGAKLGDWD